MTRLSPTDITAMRRFVKKLDRKDAILHMRSQGISISDCGRVLQVSSKTIQRALPEVEVMLQNEAAEQEPSVTFEEQQAMMEWSVDAFELFFETFSGRKLPSHARPWVDAFLNNPNVLINCPSRHAKTTIMCQWIPIWLITRNRNEQILIVTKSSGLAVKSARAIAVQLSGNQLLINTWGEFQPDVKGKDGRWSESAGELQVKGRTMATQGAAFSVACKGYQSSILGNEATVVICDDVTDRRISQSPTERERQLEWLQGEVFSRLQPGGRAMVIGQRVDVNDLYSTLASQTFKRGDRRGDMTWEHFSFPAVLRWPDEDPSNPEPEVLWEAQWSFKDLMEVYERLGHDLFSSYMQQMPVPDGGGLFNDDWLPMVLDHDRKSWERPYVENEDMLVRVLSIDPSPTQFHGVVLADLEFEGRERQYKTCHILASYRVKAKGLQNLIKDVSYLLKKHRPGYLLFEQSGFSRWIEDSPEWEDWKQQTRVVRQKTTGQSKNHEQYGLQSLASDFEMGRIKLPYANAEAREFSDQLLDEARTYPSGYTSDVLMAAWFIRSQSKYLRAPGQFTPQSEHAKPYGYIKRASNRPFGFVRRALGENNTEQDRRVAMYREDKRRRAEKEKEFQRKLEEEGVPYDTDPTSDIVGA